MNYSFYNRVLQDKWVLRNKLSDTPTKKKNKKKHATVTNATYNYSKKNQNTNTTPSPPMTTTEEVSWPIYVFSDLALEPAWGAPGRDAQPGDAAHLSPRPSLALVTTHLPSLRSY